MNKFTILLSLLLYSFTPLNAEENESAYKLCKTFFYSSEKLECLNIVKDRYFSDQAVQVCATLSLTSVKMDCLKVIANKSFSNSALAICRQFSFASEILSCLGTAANDLSSCVNLGEVEASVYQALGELKSQRPSRAELTLEKLLDRIQECS